MNTIVEEMNPELTDSVIKVVSEDKEMRFSSLTSLTAWRAKTLFTKEPETISWLNELTPSDVLLDVGANVGIYTIFAAATRHCQVVAVEPESGNFHLLNKNIKLNSLHSNVKAYCIAMSDRCGFSVLNIKDTRIGGSNHSAGTAKDFQLNEFSPNFIQGCVAYTIDEFVSSPHVPFPTRMKIDVDGFEHLVIRGGAKTIRDPRLESLIIETNISLSEHAEMVRVLLQEGFRVDLDQVNRSMRKEGIFSGVAEYVFRR